MRAGTVGWSMLLVGLGWGLAGAAGPAPSPAGRAASLVFEALPAADNDARRRETRPARRCESPDAPTRWPSCRCCASGDRLGDAVWGRHVDRAGQPLAHHRSDLPGSVSASPTTRHCCEPATSSSR
ncbi:MAG: hypothetical protein R3E68_02780 [Burkholderiaceae bacterium]